MPAVDDNTGRVAKRKRPQSEKGPLKRVRPESGEEDAQARILLLENEVFESKRNYNNIPILIKIVKADTEEIDDAIVAAISLCRIFSRFMVSGDLEKTKNSSEKDVVVIRWLWGKYSEYKTALLVLLGEESVASTILTLCMRLLKSEGQYLRHGEDYNFPSDFLVEIVQVLLSPGCDRNVRREFSENFVEEYDDIRFYTFEAIDKIFKDGPHASDGSIFDNAIEVLTTIESVPEDKEELEDFYVPAPNTITHDLYSLTKHKRRAQQAWLALIKTDMSKEQRKTILGLVDSSLAPWFMQPELLMDFLTDSYNTGGSTSLLALSGVFYLIDKRNLDYPSFYRKLYSLLDAGILHSKHRSKFFRLLDTFLGSTHLPAVLVASFLKRMSRLTLSAPPAGIVVVVPWLYNILKKHPICTFMIHRMTRGAEAKRLLENEGLADPFIMEEEDPMETNAIESCLWEIVMLQSHYHPNVATLAQIISEQFTKQAYNIEDFLDHSYGSMLEAELSKDMKKIPVVEFEIPKKIFTKNDVDSGIEDSLLVKLWDFN